MSRLSIVLKIISGFLCVLALLAVVSFIAYRVMRQSNAGFDDFRAHAEQSRLAARVQVALQRVRLAEKDVLHGVTSARQAYEERYQTLLAVLAEARQSVGDPAMAERFNALAGDAAAYGQGMKALGALNAELETLRQGFEAQAAAMEKNLEAARTASRQSGDLQAADLAGESLEQALRGQLALVRYMATGAAADLEASRGQFQSVQGHLDDLGRLTVDPAVREMLTAAADSRSRYLELEERLQTLVAERDRLAAEALRKVGDTIVENGNGLQKSINDEIAALGARIKADNAAAERHTLLLTLLAVAVGLGVAIFIGLAVARPLKKTMAYAQAVAAGDFEAPFDLGTRGDEIGRMARAVAAIPATLRLMSERLEGLGRDIARGALDAQADSAGLTGGFAHLLVQVNGLSNRFRGLLDLFPNPIMTMDLGHDVLYANKAMTGLLGAGYKGRRCADILKTAHCNTDQCACRLAMRRNEVHSSAQAFELAGRTVDIDYAGVPLTDDAGAVVGALELIVDQTVVRDAQRMMLDVARRADEIAESVSAASDELSAQVEQVSRGAETQRDRMTETATSMEQMNATVIEVARNASQAASHVDQARDKAASGSDVVHRAVDAICRVQSVTEELRASMASLGEQAQAIGQVVEVINDIADQTNLLALNAAIEAARAGEAGRGFAVVADEVRKLAEKTMSATLEVKTTVGNIRQATSNNLKAMDQAALAVAESSRLAQASGEALSEIVTLVVRNSDQVSGIAAASEEQSAASEQISRAVEEVTRITVETADGMSQSAKAVHELAAMAGKLRVLIAELKG